MPYFTVMGPRPLVAPVWTPASLTGLIGWWEADVGVTQVAGRVSQWANQSSGGNVDQATAGNKPLYSATGFNTSFPGITFVHTRPDFLSNTSFTLASTTLSIFVLFHPTNADESNSGWVSIKAASAGNDFANPGCIVEGDGNAGSLESMNFYSSGAQGGNVVWAGFPAASLFGLTANGTTAKTYKDGALNDSGACSSTFGDSPNVLAFGTRPWNSNTPSVDGTYAGVFIGTQAWSTTEIANLVTYINSKWGTAF